MTSSPNRFGHIHVQPAGDLASTALLLGQALGIQFVKDDQGRYDEFPAYIAECDGVRYALLGVPQPEQDVREDPTDDFELMIEPLAGRSGITPKEVEEVLSRIRADGRVTCSALN